MIFVKVSHISSLILKKSRVNQHLYQSSKQSAKTGLSLYPNKCFKKTQKSHYNIDKHISTFMIKLISINLWYISVFSIINKRSKKRCTWYFWRIWQNRLQNSWNISAEFQKDCTLISPNVLLWKKGEKISMLKTWFKGESIQWSTVR